jgi:hypothetical protein
MKVAMTIKRLLFISMLFIWLPAISQNKDFGVWLGGNINHEIFKKVDIGLGVCLRTNQNASHTDQFYTDLGIGYKFNKYIAVSGNYRWIIKDESYNQYFSRYRFYTDLKLLYPLSNFKFSTRFRLQSQYKQYAEKPEDKLPEYYGRIKAQIYYNWPFIPFNPYVSAEWFYPLNNDAVKYADQKRLTIGIEYKINKKHSVDAEFLLQREYLPHFTDTGIVAVTYNFEF